MGLGHRRDHPGEHFQRCGPLPSTGWVPAIFYPAHPTPFPQLQPQVISTLEFPVLSTGLTRRRFLDKGINDLMRLLTPWGGGPTGFPRTLGS